MPCSASHATAHRVSRPPENAMPSLVPVGGSERKIRLIERTLSPDLLGYHRRDVRRTIVLAVAFAGCAGGGDDGGVPRVRSGATGLAGPAVPALDADSTGPVDVVWDAVHARP